MITALITVTVLLLGAAAFYVYRSVPDHRTAFLVDASVPVPAAATRRGADFAAVARAVGSAAQNAGEDDALSLRRFGGDCGKPENTSQVVASGTSQGRKIADSVRGVTPGGQATLGSGIAAAIDDFDGLHPFRGEKSNRIIVVTSSGRDACTSDQRALLKDAHDKAKAAGLELEFRFVGYKVPAGERADLGRLATAVNAPAPRFADTADTLTPELQKLMPPKEHEARNVTVPSSPGAPETSARPEHPFVVGLFTGWAVNVTGTPVRCAATTNATTDRECRFTMREGERITLQAAVSGPNPNPMGDLAEQNNPYYEPRKTPYWYGCDEGPRSRTCTVTMTKERVETSKRWADSASSPTGMAATRLLACVTTEETSVLTLARTCAALTGSEAPPDPEVTYADGSTG
ncbi:hypothetical protein AB5J55_41760 [Streptomyces sp. R11]|uniref:VWFA domain-containing protein n=1 Tax=Streptomyces sp. R11 TaxID=3238625 RepID=A0AB39ND64_9ACTN